MSAILFDILIIENVYKILKLDPITPMVTFLLQQFVCQPEFFKIQWRSPTSVDNFGSNTNLNIS